MVDAQAMMDPKRTAPRLAFRGGNRLVLGLAALGALLLWAAFPPVAVWPLAAVALSPWIYVCRREVALARHDYWVLYLAGLVHWLLVVHWVRLPHWSAWFGWYALAAYLAAYVPWFVAWTRAATRVGLPLVLAAPTVWCGLEWIRSHLFTGFPMALLGHTVVKQPMLIQLADTFGGYGVSFVIAMVAACVACAVAAYRRWQEMLTYFAAAGLVVVAALGYGKWRLDQVLPVERSEDGVRVALIQGCIDTVFDDKDHTQETYDHYFSITKDALEHAGPFDLVVWPESMFSFSWVRYEDPIQVPEEEQDRAEAFLAYIRGLADSLTGQASQLSEHLKSELIVGAPQFVYGPEGLSRYNSALHMGPEPKVSIYNKMHPVLFGEYLPLGDVFPWVYRLSPMGNGLTAGSAPQTFEVSGVRFQPCICFENTLPHLLRRQFTTLCDQGAAPDVLLTLTNDGWFWGSSLLDLHLACGVFRAVELRRPMLIAANTGFRPILTLPAACEIGGRGETWAW